MEPKIDHAVIFIGKNTHKYRQICELRITCYNFKNK